MRDTHIIHRRNHDFLMACRRAMERLEPSSLTIDRVVSEALLEPAPFYYITYEYARKRLTQYEHGRLPRAEHPYDCALARIREIHARVEQLVKGHAIKRHRALQQVLTDGNASSFFLTHAGARRLYHRLRRQRRLQRLTALS